MTLFSHTPTDRDGFRLRGLETTRVDGFSDVVFGFALTLLVVSLEVPKSYAELHDLMRGFAPFAVSFVLLMTVWYAHYQFFRRFGLQDVATIVMNAALLFVVLFFVYPLKFLLGLLVIEALGRNAGTLGMDPKQVTELMVVYGLGFAAIYLLLAAMYWNAWRHRDELKLTPVERRLTRLYILDNATLGLIGVLSCVLALVLPPSLSGLAGFAFLLIAISKTAFGFSMGHVQRTVRAGVASKG